MASLRIKLHLLLRILYFFHFYVLLNFQEYLKLIYKKCEITIFLCRKGFWTKMLTLQRSTQTKELKNYNFKKYIFYQSTQKTHFFLYFF